MTQARATAGQSRRGKSADVAAARARVVELAVLGWAPERIAQELGRSLRWVKRARDEMKLEISRAAEAKVAGAKEGAAAAKELLVSATVAAARRVVELGVKGPRLKKETAIKAAALGLKADLAILDRGGVPAKAELDVDGTLLESIHQTLDRARKGVK